MDTLVSVLLINFAVTLAWLGGLFFVLRHYHRTRIKLLERDRDFDAQEAERRRAHQAKLEFERHAVLERMFHAAKPIVLEAFRVIDNSKPKGRDTDQPDYAGDASYSPCSTQCCDRVVS